jgi:hypothetical protein
VSGLVLWLDGTQGLTMDGATTRVTSWASRVGSTVVSQPTTSLMPLSTTLNGLPAVLFDGADDYLTSTSFALAQPCTWFVVMSAASLPASGLNMILIDGKLGSPTGRQIISISNVPPLRYGFGAASQRQSGTPDTSPHLLQSVFNGTQSFFWIDSFQSTAGDEGSQAQDGLMVGGRGMSGGSLYNGIVAEVVAYNRQISTSESAAVRTYLKTKWGTP